MTVATFNTNPVLPHFHWKPDSSFSVSSKEQIQEWDASSAEFVDRRSLGTIILHRIKAIWVLCKAIPLYIKEIFKDIFGSNKHAFYDLTDKETTDKLDENSSNKDLYVFIPGLDAHPAMWTRYKQNIQRYYKNLSKEADVRIIRNKNNGKQEFKDTYTPIYKMVSKYCTKNPAAKVVLIGTSLGALAASQIEVELRKEYSNSVFVGSITGAYGSKLVSLINKIPLVRNILPKDLRDRFSFGNDFTKALIEEQRSIPLLAGCKRSFAYYGGMDETFVFPTSEEHPRINSENGDISEKHFNVYGAGHIGTTEVATDHLLRQAYRFHSS